MVNHNKTHYLGNLFLLLPSILSKSKYVSNIVCIHMGVSKNRGTPKWMVYVYNGKLIKMDDLGVPVFLETPIYILELS